MRFSPAVSKQDHDPLEGRESSSGAREPYLQRQNRRDPRALQVVGDAALWEVCFRVRACVCGLSVSAGSHRQVYFLPWSVDKRASRQRAGFWIQIHPTYGVISLPGLQVP